MLRRRDFIKFALAGIVLHSEGALSSFLMPAFGQRNTGIIKVVGIGDSGCNIVDYIIKNLEMPEVEFITINTNERSLAYSLAMRKIHIGRDITCGIGTGGNHEIGKEAALNARGMIAQTIKGAGSVVIITGLGGGTGTGASPVIAKIAREMDIMTAAVVTMPFYFEGTVKSSTAEQGMIKLKELLKNRVFAISYNHNLLVNDRDRSMRNLFLFADALVCKIVRESLWYSL